MCSAGWPTSHPAPRNAALALSGLLAFSELLADASGHGRYALGLFDSGTHMRLDSAAQARLAPTWIARPCVHACMLALRPQPARQRGEGAARCSRVRASELRGPLTGDDSSSARLQRALGVMRSRTDASDASSSSP